MQPLVVRSHSGCECVQVVGNAPRSRPVPKQVFASLWAHVMPVRSVRRTWGGGKQLARFAPFQPFALEERDPGGSLLVRPPARGHRPANFKTEKFSDRFFTLQILTIKLTTLDRRTTLDLKRFDGQIIKRGFPSLPGGQTARGLVDNRLSGSRVPPHEGEPQFSHNQDHDEDETGMALCSAPAVCPLCSGGWMRSHPLPSTAGSSTSPNESRVRRLK